MIDGWAGGHEPALAWYQTHQIPSFGRRTAEQLVEEGKGDAVIDYLESVALGSFE